MKKQIISVIVAFLLICVPMAAKAAIGTTAGSGSICPGSEADIPISVTNCNGVSAISLALSYDADKVTYLGYQNPSTHFGSNLHVNATGGVVYLTWYSLNAVDFGSEVLIEFRFEGISGTTALTWNTAECEYSNANGNAIQSTYANGSLTVYNLPSITSQPTNVTVTEGQNTGFTVSATGSGISYQWQVKAAGQNDWADLANGTPYSYVTSSHMYITGTPLNLNGNQYRCKVSGNCEPAAYSDAALLTVYDMLPTITTTAGTVSTCPDNEFGIAVSVTNCNNVGAISLALNYNAELVNYAGYQNPNAGLANGLTQVNEHDGTVYFSWIATESQLSIGNAILVEFLFESQSGNTSFGWDAQQCEYSNGAGRLFPTSFVSGSATVYYTPYITSQPANKTVDEGSNTTFAVQAGGHGLSYQWQESTDGGETWADLSSGSHYNNVTSATMTVVGATLDMDGNRYRCLVGGTCEPDAVSESALLHVNPLLPTITTRVDNVASCEEVEFDAEVLATNFQNVGAVSLALNYDTTSLTFLGYENLNSVLADGSLYVNATDGTVYVSWMSVSGATIGNGRMLSLRFVGQPGSHALTWNTSRCEYSNLQGLVFPTTYQNGTATVYYAPYITNQPVNKTINEGQGTTFSVTAGGRALSYQWQVSGDDGETWADLSNGSHYGNVTNRVMNVYNATLDMNGLRYRCRVSGECEPEIVSESAKLTVNHLLPTITTRAGSLITCSDTEFGVPITVTNFNEVGAVSLSLAYNANVLAFQGYDGVNAHLNGGELHVNAADGVVYITWISVDGTTIGNGTLLWLNFVGSVGNSQMTWNTASCEYATTDGDLFPVNFINGSVTIRQQNFSITSHPESIAILETDTTTFAITTTGASLTFQWQVSEDEGVTWNDLTANSIYAGVNTRTLTINGATWDMDGNLYRCSVSGSCGVQYSQSALLTVGLLEDFHDVVAAVMPENAGTVTGEGTYYRGDTVTMTATPNTGYHFANWMEADTIVSTSDNYSFVIHEDHDFVANFELNQYDISVSSNIGSAGDLVGAGTYFYGDTCTLTATPSVGYIFLRWTLNGNLVTNDASFSFVVTENRNYVAHFQQLSYEIMATALPEEGGTVSGAGTYPHGTTCTLVATANEDYAFVNWTRGGIEVSADATYSFAVTEAGVYVAHFYLESVSYQITAIANPSAGGTVTGGGSYHPGEPCTLTAMANVGYTFVNWTLNGEEVSTDATYSFTVTEAVAYAANFAPVTCEVTTAVNPEESGSITGAGIYEYGTTVTLTATASTGYTFVNWTQDGAEVSTNRSYSFVVTEDASFVANFSLNSYTIAATVNPGESGTVEGIGTYDHFSTCTLTATANTGYHFLSWTLDGEVVTTDPTYSFEVSGPADYVANFELNSYDITAAANPTEGGTIAGAGTYNHFNTCTLTATANTGYHFLSWTLGGEVVTTDAVYSFDVTGPADYVANFELNSYDVTAAANPEAGGTVTGAGTYDHFSTCTLAATANTGYHFLSWTLDGEVVTTDPAYSFEVSGPADYVANFELNSYDITATANPEAGGTVTGAGTYDHFSTCTLTATANTGYHFLSWTLGGEVVTTDPAYSFEVNGPADYVANFELNSYDITAAANPTEGGTIAGAGTYNHFSTCTLTATANMGYHFLSWTLGGEVVTTDPTYSFEVSGPADYVANFELNSYDITATANPEAGGTVTGAGTYDHFSTCTLAAMANTGYHFISWTLDGEVVSSEPTHSFIVTEASAFVANFEPTAITQTSSFVPGWNWWSGYVELDGASSLQSLQDGLGTSGMMIKSQNDGYASYLAGFGWYGSLTTINNESTYQVKSNAACTVELTGGAANPEDHPITLNSGWTWVGYPVAVSMGVADALSGITPHNGDMLKSQNDGYASYLAGYGWYGSLSTLNPGMGLMYKSNAGADIVLTYPEGGTRGDLKSNQTAEGNHWQPDLNAYPDNMSVTAIVELDGSELRSERYELAAFANGECRGSARLLYIEPLDRYMAFLTVAGDEAAELRFSLYDAETGTVETQNFASLQYETNAVVGSFEEPCVVSFRSTTGVDEWANGMQVYPNPIEHGQLLTIGFMEEEAGALRIEIINALGAVVETVSAPSVRTIAAPKTAGVYTLRVTVEGKGTCYRKLVVR